MRIGVFGGTFDPVHYGHLLAAECCREQCRLDQVWFLPAAVPPHKQHTDMASSEHRLAMLQLAIGGHEPFVLSRLEIDRGGLSYTVDTLASLVEQQPAAEWYFLMGSDSLADLPGWREPARICELATIVVVVRPSAPPPDFAPLAGMVSAARLQHMREHVVRMPLVDLSSREIRRCVAEGRSIRFRTPRAVEKYIETHGLYRSSAAPQSSG
jgi:nicotinate-nucleotide adenylyltransferase